MTHQTALQIAAVLLAVNVIANFTIWYFQSRAIKNLNKAVQNQNACWKTQINKNDLELRMNVAQDKINDRVTQRIEKLEDFLKRSTK